MAVLVYKFVHGRPQSYKAQQADTDMNNKPIPGETVYVLKPGDEGKSLHELENLYPFKGSS